MAQALPLATFAALIPQTALAALPRGPLRARALRGGRGVNLCLRIDDESGESCVLRLRRGPQLAGADLQRELASQQLAADAGLAPAVLAADLQQGWVLMQYVPESPWTLQRLREPQSLYRLGTRLRELHAVAPPPFAPVDSLGLLQAHCAVLTRGERAAAAHYLQRGGELVAQLELLPHRPPVLCHGDPDVENFLGDAPVLLDFEYAQVADPTYDVALLLAYYPCLDGQVDALLAATGLEDDLSRRRLPLQLELCRVINAAWAQAQAQLTRLD